MENGQHSSVLLNQDFLMNQDFLDVLVPKLWFPNSK